MASSKSHLASVFCFGEAGDHPMDILYFIIGNQFSMNETLRASILCGGVNGDKQTVRMASEPFPQVPGRLCLSPYPHVISPSKASLSSLVAHSWGLL